MTLSRDVSTINIIVLVLLLDYYYFLLFIFFRQCIDIILLPRDASAERGDATVSRPSVCLSVCDV